MAELAYVPETFPHRWLPNEAEFKTWDQVEPWYRQLLRRPIESAEDLRREVSAWEGDRNERMVGVHWQFTTAEARIKLHRLYPSTQ